jgi:UDP-N-acetylmuramate dehydrogenase
LPRIEENKSLKAYNTFGIEAKTRYFTEISNVDELKAIILDEKLKSLPKLILGGGSNILFTRDFEGLAIKNNIKGIEKITEDENHIWIKAYSGEVWHELVEFAIENNLGGIENLSLIPGTVGAAPIQNIGAYGVELKDVFDFLEAVDLQSGEIKVFDANKCLFGYRQSIFKGLEKGKYFILSVTLRLNKNPELNMSYGAISNTLEEMQIKELNVKAISKAVCQIRNSKLPNPLVIGNAGSFFKNPEIYKAHFDKLKAEFPNIPGYPVADKDKIKVPAGWLIEQCGWKGKRVGETGSHKDQSLVLVNYGNAQGSEIEALAKDIQRSVLQKFGIELETEVNIL